MAGADLDVPPPTRSAPPRRPSSAPGEKRARHRRWTRIATTVTILAVGTFVAFLVWVAPRLKGKSEAQMQHEGCEAFLDGIAGQVRTYVDLKGRMPRTLGDLRDFEVGSQYDAEPWDCWSRPIEYSVLDAAARTFRLRSSGPDRTSGTADDIVWPRVATPE
jgi:competence protein ComGC